MITYVTAFIFYTLAMIGVMLIGFIVYKKTLTTDKNENKKTIKIIDSLPIGNRKNLLIVKIKNEKFLIASGADHTTFLSKLENTQSDCKINKNEAISPEMIDMSIVKNTHKDNFKQEQIPRYDDIKISKNSQLQKQFMELYSKEDVEKQKNNPSNRKEAIKEILNKLVK